MRKKKWKYFAVAHGIFVHLFFFFVSKNSENNKICLYHNRFIHPSALIEYFRLKAKFRDLLTKHEHCCYLEIAIVSIFWKFTLLASSKCYIERNPLNEKVSSTKTSPI